MAGNTGLQWEKNNGLLLNYSALITTITDVSLVRGYITCIHVVRCQEFAGLSHLFLENIL